MNYNIFVSDNFKNEAKRLIKKYPSIKDDIKLLTQILSENPKKGIHLGNDVYKVRMSISSLNKGKSGGARIIYFIKIVDTAVYLLSIYIKTSKANLSSNEIKDLLKDFI